MLIGVFEATFNNAPQRSESCRMKTVGEGPGQVVTSCYFLT